MATNVQFAMVYEQRDEAEMDIWLHSSGAYVDPNPPLDPEEDHLCCAAPTDDDVGSEELSDLHQVMEEEISRGRSSMPPGCYHHPDR